MNLSEDEVQKILRVIDELDYGEIRIELGDLKLHIVKSASGEGRPPALSMQPASSPAATQATPPPVAGPPDAIPERPAGAPLQPTPSAALHLVRAPTAGVFYTAPSPGAAPFVRAGQTVTPTDTVCLLEVMKLFQSIDAGVAGRVAEILAGNGQAVAASQPLVSIELF
jgi:acetyl-CoA carboxylase biotin carboxyl carrier protein